MRRTLHLPRPPVWHLKIYLRYSNDGKEIKCPCSKDGSGECKCGPDCQCPHCKEKNALKRLGTSPRNNRDHPIGCVPQTLNTTAFESPDFIPASTYRILDPDEQIGPNAHKDECYKNPEYYSYYRYSYFDLKTIVDTIRKQKAAKNPK